MLKDEKCKLTKDKDTIGREYDMNETDYQRCLIAAEISTFVDAHGVEKPKSIFTVAQPGARKDRLEKLYSRRKSKQ